ncbi:MAG: Xaa-Pro peptidase family protein [Actinomycetota bacterium]|nr:Xaa-Pro peptidase family protein [Actinomycetota bacterium]
MIQAARHAERRGRLRAMVSEAGPGRAMLVTDLANIRYLTGFSGSNAVLLVGGDPSEDLIGTDGRYQDQVAEEAPGLPVVIDRDTLAAVVRCAPAGPVAIESSLPVGDERRLAGERGPVVVTDRLVAGMRAVKDPDEVALLERSCAITVAGLAGLAEEIRVGVTEVDLARRLEQIFGSLGAEDRAFDSIVGAGPNSAIPHHRPGRRPLEAGDLLVVDAGARVDGYHADMTRTFVVGADPDTWQSDIHGAVWAAHAAATAEYRPGADARSVDGVARAVIDSAGFGAAFTHGLGHGVGLEIHEAPMVGPRATGSMAPDMAITVEPGVYLLGRGGVRIEDTLVVTDNGPRVLTEAPRELVVVG